MVHTGTPDQAIGARLDKANAEMDLAVQSYLAMDPAKKDHVLSTLSGDMKDKFLADVKRARDEQGRNPDVEKVAGVGADQDKEGPEQGPNLLKDPVKVSELYRAGQQTKALGMGIDADKVIGRTADEINQAIDGADQVQMASLVNVEEFACLQCAEANLTGQFDNGLHNTAAQRGTDDLFLTGQA